MKTAAIDITFDATGAEEKVILQPPISKKATTAPTLANEATEPPRKIPTWVWGHASMLPWGTLGE
jgi:hypothetical protein